MLGEARLETIGTLSLLAEMARRCNDRAHGDVLLGLAGKPYVLANEREHPETILVENSHLQVLRIHCDVARAGAGLVALPRTTKALPSGNWQLAAIRGGNGKAVYLDGRFVEGEPLILESWRTISGQFPPADPRTAAARERVVELYRLWGQPGPADQVLASAVG